MAIIQTRGDSFDYTVPMPDSFADGHFVGWQCRSQVRTVKYAELVAELTCTWVDPTTTRNLHLFELSTIDWPLVACEMDVQFVRNSDNYTYSSSIESITVIRDVTQPLVSP